MSAQSGSDPGARALDYPYATPGGLLRPARTARALPSCRRRSPDLAGRTPLLAYGANAAPEALARKLAPLPAIELPVLRAELERLRRRLLRPRLSATARCPATLVRAARGRWRRVHVVYPTDEQLAAIAATEAELRARAARPTSSAELEIGRGAGGARRLRQRHGCAARRRLAGRPRRGPGPRPRLRRADDAGDDRPRPRRAVPDAERSSEFVLHHVETRRPARRCRRLEPQTAAKRRRASAGDQRRRRRSRIARCSSGPPIPAPAGSSAAVIASQRRLEGEERGRRTWIAS